MTSLDEKLNDLCEQAQIPSMSIIVAKEGQAIFEKNYGYRHVEEQQPVTKDTVFGVASLTKSLACLAIMQLEDKGKLIVEDPVVKWLPEFTIPNDTYREQITIHHLMTHTGGLPGMAAVNLARENSIKNDPDGALLFGEIPTTDFEVNTVADVMKAIEKADVTLLGAPGEVFNYSNESYALLQKIIEQVSGESFLKYMDNHILKPLEMDRSTFLTVDVEKLENVTELYAFKQDNGRTVFHSPSWWDVGSVYTNGSLKSTTADMMKYLEVFRRNGVVDGKRIVSETSLKKMTTPHYITPNEVSYGYGLLIDRYADMEIIGHGGGVKGVSSFMLVVREKEITITVLTNIAEVSAENIAMTSLEYVLGLTEHEEEQPQVNWQPSIKQLEKYTGIYASDEGHQVTAYIAEDQFYLLVKNNNILLTPYAENKFLTPDGKKVAFIVNNQQEVTGIFRGLRFIHKKK